MNPQSNDTIFPQGARVEAQLPDHTVCRMEFPDGEGRMSAWPVMPGITLIFNDFRTACGIREQMRRPGMVEINHCRSGRYECVAADGAAVSLGPQDFSVSSMAHPIHSAVFTMGEYRGISLMLDVKTADRSVSAMMGESAFCLSDFFDRLFAERSLYLLRSDPKIQHIFSELYQSPPSLRNAYFRLKTAELLLFLYSGRLTEPPEAHPYFSRDLSARTREIAARMTEDLRLRTPIHELAKQYKLSENTLKKRFIQLYGEPPYSYLRRRRMEYAAFLLETTNRSVTDVAAEVGYLNASKFSAAFRGIYGVTPRDYKKGIRLD